MIGLYVVPVRQFNKGLAFTVFDLNVLRDNLFPYKEVDTHTNLESAASKMIAKYFDQDTYEIQFNSIIQPCENRENISIIYRALIRSGSSDEILRDIPITIRRESKQLKDGRTLVVSKVGFPETSMSALDYEIGCSVINEMHNKMMATLDPKTNKEGFSILLGLLDDTFDIKELHMAYTALTGKTTSSPKMLANSLLDSYQVGLQKDGSPRLVFGRDMIEELSVDDPKVAAELEKKRQRYRDLYSDDYAKGGKKVKTIFRKKNLTPTHSNQLG